LRNDISRSACVLLAGYSFIDQVMGELNSSTSNDYHNIIQLSTSEDAYDIT